MSISIIEATIKLMDKDLKQTSRLNEELLPKEQKEARKMAGGIRPHASSAANFVELNATPGTLNEFQPDKDTKRNVIRIPISLNHDNPEPSDHVKKFLEDKGYHIKDADSYRRGIAHKEITTGDPSRGIPLRTKFQEQKIGSILEKHDAPEHIKSAFQHDPVRVGAGNHDYDLVISHHPEDVYGMSTGRGWTSCANMRKKHKDDELGPAAKRMQGEIENHTHVAYLVKRGGNYDTDAMARIAFKPHTAVEEKNKAGGKHQTLVSEGTVYGIAPTDFRNVAESEMAKRFPIKDDAYVKNGDVYNDSGKSVHIPNKVSPEKLDSLWENIGNNHQKSELYSHVRADGNYNSKDLRDVRNTLADIVAPLTNGFGEGVDKLKNAHESLSPAQIHYGIKNNVNHPDLAVFIAKTIVSHFNPNDSEHIQHARGLMSLLHRDYSGVATAIKDEIKKRQPIVKTVSDYEAANNIQKAFGGSANGAHITIHPLTIHPQHELGSDPMMSLGKAGVLKNENDFAMAHQTFGHGGDNYFGTIHRLAANGAKHADQARQVATMDLDELPDHYLKHVYQGMNPDAQKYYSQQLGHKLEDYLA